MLADPDSAHTGLPRLRAVSPPGTTRPSSPACERQRWPRVYRSDVSLPPLGHPSAGRAVRPAAARCPTVFESRNTVCAARPSRPSWCIFLCILCLVLRSCEGADSSTRVSNCQKRSYFRAVRRAQQMGQIWYRGRRLTAQQLGSALTCTPPAPGVPKPRPPPQTRNTGPRLKVCSFNAGGVTTELFSELLLWATENQLQVLAIQESHWKADSESSLVIDG